MQALIKPVQRCIQSEKYGFFRELIVVGTRSSILRTHFRKCYFITNCLMFIFDFQMKVKLCLISWLKTMCWGVHSPLIGSLHKQSLFLNLPQFIFSSGTGVKADDSLILCQFFARLFFIRFSYGNIPEGSLEQKGSRIVTSMKPVAHCWNETKQILLSTFLCPLLICCPTFGYQFPSCWVQDSHFEMPRLWQIYATPNPSPRLWRDCQGGLELGS